MNAATPVLAPTMLNAPSGPDLDLLCVQQSGAASLKKEEMPILANIGSCPNFLD